MVLVGPVTLQVTRHVFFCTDGAEKPLNSGKYLTYYSNVEKMV